MSLPDTIKALQIQPGFTVKVIDLPFASQENVKNLPANQVLVRTRAVGINPTDWKHAIADMWGYPNTISGCDGAGEVVKVGSAVTNVKVGDRVFGFVYGGRYSDNGAYSQYTRFNSTAVAPIPDGMSYAEAAAFPIPHITAAMYMFLRLKLPLPSTNPNPSPSPRNFIVWGGSSAVGHHAIQLAKLCGYRVVTTASEKNHEFLKSIGADVTIDYKDKEVAQKLKEAVKDGGLKYAIDTISENGSTEIILDCITEDNAHIMATLPVTPKIPAQHPNTKVEFALAYSITMEEPYKFARHVEFFPDKAENEEMKKYLSTELPKILAGWVEGKGSAKFKGQSLKIGHGLEHVSEGLTYMKEGMVSAEKLVYIVD